MRLGKAVPALVPADLGRVLAAVSVVPAWRVGGFASAATMFLVLGGTMLPRALGVPAVVDTAIQAVFLAAGWFSVTDAYTSVRWLDLVTHVATAAAATLVAWYLMLSLRLLGRSAKPSRQARSLVTLVVISIGALMGVAWEVGEWAGHHVISRDIRVGYDDTVADLLADVVGALLVALVVARRSAVHPSAAR